MNNDKLNKGIYLRNVIGELQLVYRYIQQRIKNEKPHGISITYMDIDGNEHPIDPKAVDEIVARWDLGDIVYQLQEEFEKL